MPRWKPKTINEKFSGEMQKLERKIAAKRKELEQLETAQRQLQQALEALGEASSSKGKP